MLSGFGGLLSAAAQARLVPVPGTKVKLFDPKDGFGAITNIRTFTDSTIFKRGKQWWMIAGGFDLKHFTIILLSASLPPGAPLGATGWKVTTAPNDPSTALAVVPPASPKSWDGAGGMHCPCYVRGGGRERIYYAGSSTSFTGPYSIGCLEWNGSEWVRHGDSPVLTPTEPWEMPTVAEPYVIYHDGKWKMWYLAGPNKEKQFLQGYAESLDGSTNWKKQLFLPGDQNVFDNNVIAANSRFECVFSRYPLLSGKLGPGDGLWWRYASHPFPEASRWSTPVQLLSPLDGSAAWHSGGVWKPSFHYGETDPNRAFVFFDGSYAGAAPFPIYTLGCIECKLVR